MDVVISILSRLEVLFETLTLLAIDFLYFRTTIPSTMITAILLKIRIFCQFSFILTLPSVPQTHKDLFLQYHTEEYSEIYPSNIFKITGKKSGYGITHSINSLLWVSLSMEPKSIAFYTAVAVSILAVLSATTFPTMAQAQGTDTQETQEQTEQEDNDVVTKQTDSESNEDVKDQTDSQEEESNSANSNDNAAASERLGLRPNSGIASCGQVVTQDVTLTSDLNCDNGDGLIVGASDITINLNGYSITSGDETGSESPTTTASGDETGSESPTTTASGDETGSESPTTTDYDGSSGILVANAENVAISGLGEISGFSRGVTFLGSSGGHLTDVQLANNDIGAVMASSSGTEISRNTFTNNGIAVVSDGSNGGVTAFNQIVANLREGVLLIGSSDNVVAANNMYGNGANGIYLDPMSQGNNIDYNTVFGHETADLNNADGMPTNVNQNSFGDNNNCGTSLPGGLCR
jgi:parallel beta-helix repeat protein